VGLIQLQGLAKAKVKHSGSLQNMSGNPALIPVAISGIHAGCNPLDAHWPPTL